MSNEREGALGIIDRLLPLWIGVCIVIGLLIGKYVPTFGEVAESAIPLGLFLMIYPAMTKIRMEEVRSSFYKGKSAGLVVLFNYAITPFLLWGFGYLFFKVIFVNAGLINDNLGNSLWIGMTLLGIAPCIAMVLVWTDLARGNGPLGIVLMAWNSLIQIVTTPFYIWLIIGMSVKINVMLLAQSVLLYLGLPLLLGVITRKIVISKKGEGWLNEKLIPKFNTLQLMALLSTLVIMFSINGNVILEHPELIVYMAFPLALFLAILFVSVFLISMKLRFNYDDSATMSFHCTGRNFELSIAIALTAFASMPMVSVSTVIGPLIEVPLMLGLVYFAKRSCEKLFGGNCTWCGKSCVT